jgi:preprotein translocase subunit SecG
MTTLEIVVGAFLIFSCLVIIVVVSLQSNKGDGLTSAIMGTGAVAGGRERAKTADAKLATVTKWLLAIFFVVVLALNVIMLLTPKSSDDLPDDTSVVDTL